MRGGIFLLLGSNQEDPSTKLAEARRRIQESAGTILRSSDEYITSAWGDTDQPDFRNQVIEIESGQSPQQLLEMLLHIENQMGRIRSRKWGPRIIDIDILLFRDLIIDRPGLTVPHPGIPDRRFTLLPLAEIAGEVIHPTSRKTIASMLQACTDQLSVKRAG